MDLILVPLGWVSWCFNHCPQYERNGLVQFVKCPKTSDEVYCAVQIVFNLAWPQSTPEARCPYHHCQRVCHLGKR
jgi:hypothetical protein